jgi:hypothetical protein
MERKWLHGKHLPPAARRWRFRLRPSATWFIEARLNVRWAAKADQSLSFIMEERSDEHKSNPL